MVPISIQNECSQFLNSSNGKPLYKMLPSYGDGFRKIKIRKKKHHENKFDVCFDSAFNDMFKDVRRRSLIVSQDLQYTQNVNYEKQKMKPTTSGYDKEPFYIFLPNGFEIIFNEQITDFIEYMKQLETVIDESPSNKEMMEGIFKQSFENKELLQTSKYNNDLIVYNIKYYYAIRCSLVDDYNKFIND